MPTALHRSEKDPQIPGRNKNPWDSLSETPRRDKQLTRRNWSYKPLQWIFRCSLCKHGQPLDMFSYLQGEPLHGKSKKKSVVALSSTEAEYVALAEAGREIPWPRNLYNKLGFPQEGPTNLKGDNEGAIALAKNPQFHARTKHIAIRHHWIRHFVNDDIVHVLSC